ncbi:hypothetical protein LIER_23142 [Lithospermum erythrorhizon]|uniref:Uncharacterized protein n=1 Tax=Lithospermum erythrorhizon TaxID=34254 RepID=A0AAV3QWD6_LITER
MNKKKEDKVSKGVNQVFDSDLRFEYDGEDDGHLDLIFKQDSVLKKRKGANDIDFDNYRKEIRDNAVQLFSRWLYDVSIPFNDVNYEALQAAINAIGQYGPGMKAPSYHEMRIKCLKKEKKTAEKLVEESVEVAKKNGCTLMCYGWIDRN